MRSNLAAITLLAATFTSPLAFAQTTTPAPAPPASPSATTSSTPTMATSGQWRASKLVGLNVYNEQNEKLGDISEVLIDTSGKVTGVVIGVGGFLGIGQRDILVGLDKLRFVNEPVRTTVATNTTGTTPTTTGTTTTTTTTATTTERRWYPDHAVLAGATKDSVKNMAEFKYN
jgi:sporulation protein YlmC with PRC-barrel domain